MRMRSSKVDTSFSSAVISCIDLPEKKYYRTLLAGSCSITKQKRISDDREPKREQRNAKEWYQVHLPLEITSR